MYNEASPLYLSKFSQPTYVTYNAEISKKVYKVVNCFVMISLNKSMMIKINVSRCLVNAWSYQEVPGVGQKAGGLQVEERSQLKYLTPFNCHVWPAPSRRKKKVDTLILLSIMVRYMVSEGRVRWQGAMVYGILDWRVDGVPCTQVQPVLVLVSSLFTPLCWCHSCFLSSRPENCLLSLSLSTSGHLSQSVSHWSPQEKLLPSKER